MKGHSNGFRFGKLLQTLALALTVSACGGGGGSSPATSNSPPVASFTASEVTGNAPFVVQFTSTATDADGNITSHAWDFNDGQTSSAVNPTHTFQTGGTYTVLLTVTDSRGASSFTTLTITVNNPPIASIFASPSRGTVALDVDFDAGLSVDLDGNITRYDWDFGDGSGSNDAGSTVDHSYTVTGNYTARLTVTDDDGATAIDTIDILVDTPQANLPPDASFSTSIPNSGQPLRVAFNAIASSDPDGIVVSYDWDFGDSNADTGVAPEHIYAGAGSYPVRLTVTDDDGSTATQTQTITVSATVNAAPTASFTTSVDSGAAPLGVNFDASGSSDSDGTITNYSWDFGDGNSDSGVVPNTSNLYTDSGTFTVTLTVEDDDGTKDTETATITVSPGGQFSISGVLFAADSNRVDGDVNDPFAPFAQNDFANTAQVVPNPLILGGFSSAFGTGGGEFGDDRFGSVGDVDDVYLAQLVAGQQITLEISDFDPSFPGFNDLDLYLFDTNLDLVDGSLSIDSTESLIVPADGTYYILVTAYSGISNYILTIGQNSGASIDGAGSLRFAHEAVPGEALVHLTPAATGKVLNTGERREFASARGSALEIVAGAPEREMRVRTAAFGSRAPRQNSLLAGLDATQRAQLETLHAIKALRADPAVEWADPNYIMRPLREPNDPAYDSQWHYPLINLPQAWDLSIGDDNPVVVAVIDTGVYMAHPDLAGQLTSDGYDFISDTKISNDGDGIDPNPDDPGDGSQLGDSSWHGTHVAGTVAARSNNGVGVAGTSWGAQVMPIRVLGEGGGTGYDVLQGVRYAAGLANDSGTLPANPADVINLSLGGGGFSSQAQSVYTAARANGVIVVAAAGNEATSSPSYPASYADVISVSSVGPNKALAYYSNTGSAVDVAAPGGDMSADRDGDGALDGVLSTLVSTNLGFRSATYEFYQGTSMATPHMAGVVALMRAVYPAMTPTEFELLLTSGLITEDIGAVGRDDLFGYGLIDAQLAVQQALNLASGGTIPSQLVFSPNSMDFGSFSTSQTLSVSRTGGEPLTVTSVTDDQAWLSIAADTIDGNGLGTYSVTVDRTGLPDATYTGHLTIDASDGTVSDLAVTMTVGNPVGDGDVGLIYILVVDPDTFDTIDGIGLVATSGEYAYEFVDVPAGQYLIFAGGDMDNDLFICDEGEACGAYPTLDVSNPVILDRNLTAIDFLVSFDSPASPAAAGSSSRQSGAQRGLPRPPPE